MINPLGSTHYLGFVQQITVATDPSQGVTPLFTLKDGAPYWAPVPQIDPSVSNGNSNVPYYNGETATRGSGEMTYAFNIQRQLGASMVAEIGYLGTLASNIQSSLLAYNQIPYRSLPANLNPFTAAGRTLLTSQINSAAADCRRNCFTFRRLHPGLRHRGDSGPSPASLPAIRADRYD